MSEEDFVNVTMEEDVVNTLSVEISPKHDNIGIDLGTSSTQICTTIKARDLDDDDNNRAAVDIVIALDVSGSMAGDKLTLCKKTLELLLRFLSSKDRFALVTYASRARVEIPCQLMTQENKEKSIKIIHKLRTRDCTNISDAIGLASQEFQIIENPNEVRTLFLLTDGLANAGICDSESLVEMSKNCLGNNEKKLGHASTSPITMHTFGYGKDHNASLLHDLATATPGGSYYFVENDSSVGTAFGDALGGVLSVVAQSVVVSIKSSPTNKITKVYHDQATRRENGVFTVTIGDFYAEETRDVVFEVDLINPDTPTSDKIPHASVSLSYIDTIRKVLVSTTPIECSIARPQGSEISPANQKVIKQWLRISAVENMKLAEELARTSKLDEAKLKMKEWCNNAAEECEHVDIRNDEMIDNLFSDMKECMNSVENSHNWNTFGSKKMASKKQTHTRQRCVQSIPMATSAYSTKKKSLLSKKFNLHQEF